MTGPQWQQWLEGGAGWQIAQNAFGYRGDSVLAARSRDRRIRYRGSGVSARPGCETGYGPLISLLYQKNAEISTQTGALPAIPNLNWGRKPVA